MVTTDEARNLYYDLVQWKPVLSIEAALAHPDNPDVAGFWSITFHVEGHRLTLKADDDTDEILFEVEPTTIIRTADPNLHPILLEMVGKSFGWIWYAKNVQGYEDALLLALGDGSVGAGISPQYVLLVEASVIHVQRIVPYRA